MGFLLRPYQETAVSSAIKALLARRRALIVAATGCHERGQRLLRFDGTTILVENVMVGDRLMGPDGTRRNVLALIRGEDEMVEIRPTKGEPWRVNRDHVLSLVSTCEKPTGPASRRGGMITDVSVRGWSEWGPTKKHIHKLFRVGVDFQTAAMPLPLDPYHLGVLLGDGSLVNSINITSADEEMLVVANEIAATFGLRVRTEHTPGRCPVHFIVSKHGHRSTLSKVLQHLGLRRHTAEKKFIPAAYKTATRDERLRLIAGLMDTDGSLSNSTYDFVSASAVLASDLAFVARSLGLAAYVSPCTKKCQTGASGTYFRVCLSGDTSLLPCRLTRKQAAPREQKKSVLRTGFKVVDCGYRAPFFGFTIDGDGRYLLDDFTVTHNSGKTVMFAAISERWRQYGRILVLAHREELLDQAADKISTTTSLSTGIEQADRHERHPMPDEVIASVPTLASEKRRAGFPAKDFALVIVDECHHAAATSYRTVLNHFSAAAHLGVTATHERADGISITPIFGEPVFRYGIRNGIRDRYLVDVRRRVEVLSDLDLSRIKVSGDFDAAELEAEMTRAPIVAAVADAILRHAGSRPTVVFCAGITHSKAVANALNARRPGCAVAASGEEREGVGLLLSGTVQILCNTDLTTEGFDFQPLACVCLVRATKSIVRASQQVGRGVRLFDGKEDLVVVEFVGRAAAEQVSTVGVIGSDLPPRVRMAAEDLLDRNPDMTVLTALERSSAAAGSRAIGEVRERRPIVDPMRVILGLDGMVMEAASPTALPATPAQLQLLADQGLRAAGLTIRQASLLLAGIRWRQAHRLSSPAQALELYRYGITTECTRNDADRQLAKLGSVMTASQ